MIAMELLEREHERLLRDHFDDTTMSPCPGCARAYAVSQEIGAMEPRQEPDTDDSTPDPCYECGRELAAHPASDCRDYS